MANVTFNFTDIVKASSQHAARVAVLSPLREHIEGTNAAAQLQIIGQIQKKWRMRVSMMRQAGWQAVRDSDAKTSVAQNCHPSFACFSTDPDEHYTRMSCHNYTVCPWCWGRRVSHAYDLLRHALRQSDGEIVQLAYLRGREVLLHSDLRAKFTGFTEAARILAAAFGKSRHCRGLHWLVKVAPAAPTRKSTGPEIEAIYCFLLLLDADAKVFPQPSGWQLKTWTAPTVKDMRIAIASVWNYPNLLLNGHVVDVVEIAEARVGLRWSDSYGAFRYARTEDDCG